MRSEVRIRSARRAVALSLLAASLCVATDAQAQALPPLETHLNPSETALILVDFQFPFTNPAGDSYAVVKKDIQGGMLDRTVALVKKARGLGVWVIHVTEGYTKDYRELDPTNPGGFTGMEFKRRASRPGRRRRQSILRSRPDQMTGISSWHRASRARHLAEPA